jgi:hypothetical protein
MVSELTLDELERHLSSESNVFRLEYRPHSSFTQEAKKPVSIGDDISWFKSGHG